MKKKRERGKAKVKGSVHSFVNRLVEKSPIETNTMGCEYSSLFSANTSKITIIRLGKQLFVLIIVELFLQFHKPLVQQPVSLFASCSVD